MIAVVDDGRLFDELSAAAAAEQDPETGAEMLRSVLLLAGLTSVSTVEVQAKRQATGSRG
ncbi:MAG: hypothetical protein M3541_00400 [Acidobacteriota bacterium]|nr:hypothetical protein [Acidobacteriota bacterium]MDQ3417244.1 hypothetical protein [Acidobacteriota bacterium]